MNRIMLFVLILSLLLVANSQPGWCQSQSFPVRPITYWVAYDRGGPSDVEARQQQPHLEKILGQKITIDYKLGGGGAVAWKELAQAKPDGYVLCGFNIPTSILLPLQKDVGYKTDQLTPVAVFSRTPVVLIVPQKSRYKTLSDLIDAAKEDPGAVTVGGSGYFTVFHLSMFLLERSAKVRMNFVPYTGTASTMTALLDGTTQCALVGSNDALVSKDKIRVLALATEQGMPEFPNVPAFKEKGFDIVESVDRGVAVPSGTPKEIVDKLGAAFVQIAKTPEVQAEMKKQGFIPLAMGPEETKGFIEKLIPHYRDVLAGIKK
jgi:tripartite-type tricarboxylate transporter receptor subunit TctC